MQPRRPSQQPPIASDAFDPVFDDPRVDGPGEVIRPAPPLHLSTFNRLGWQVAIDVVYDCLDVPRWWTALVHSRPYQTYESLLEVARDAAYPFTPAELEAAVDHHLRKRGPLDTRLFDDVRPAVSSSARQSGWTDLDEQYQRRFGRPFIIRSAGRSTTEIIALLATRLGNDLDTEDRVVSTQLRQIALLDLTAKIKE